MANSVLEPESEDPRNEVPFPEEPEIKEVDATKCWKTSLLACMAWLQRSNEAAFSERAIIIMGNPVVQFLEGLQPGEDTMTGALLYVFPCIQVAETPKLIMDNSSQIVSMAGGNRMAHLGICLDRNVNILMQSANSQVEKALWLARNNAFRGSDTV